MQQAIRDKALSLGFSAVGFAPARLAPEIGERLQQFIAEGKHGDMGWLPERAYQRVSPDALWPEAKSVVVVGLNYGPDHDPMENLAAASSGNISVYARGRDYHDVLKKKLRVLARYMAEELKADVKLFVDTAPVMEKPLAQLAGLGWQGKHTNLVSRDYGSWLFLGEIFTTMDLAPQEAVTDHCGACTRCLDVCPTQAIIVPYQLDARRCISYLTIEHAGPIPHEFRKAMGNRIYGCDDCLSVCPWNKFAKAGTDGELAPRPHNHLPTLAELLQLDDATFRARFTASPIKRIGVKRFLRNCLIAAGNSGDASLLPFIMPLMEDESALVRGAAIWALAQLAPETLQQHPRKALETDADVLAEWMHADALP